VTPQIPNIENWKQGQKGQGVSRVSYEAKQTTPPKPYTEATLLGDMKAAAKFIADPKLREALKEAEGIGTSATRAATIEKLKDMGYLKIEKGAIRSSPEGQSVIGGLPDVLTNPGTTAMWEEMLARVQRGEMPMQKFMDMIEAQVAKLVVGADSSTIKSASKPGAASGGGSFAPAVSVDTPCPQCGGKLSMTDRWLKCEKNDFTVFREIASLKLKDDQLLKLVKAGRIGPLDGFKSKAKTRFSAALVLDKAGKVTFDFQK